LINRRSEIINVLRFLLVYLREVFDPVRLLCLGTIELSQGSNDGADIVKVYRRNRSLSTVCTCSTSCGNRCHNFVPVEVGHLLHSSKPSKLSRHAWQL